MKPSKLRHWFLVHFVAHFLVHFVANSVAHLRAVVLTTVFAAALAATAVGADKPDRDADDLPDKLVAAIEQRISAEMKRSRIPGLSVAVAVDNKLRYAKGFGWADLENKFAATPDTVYRTASIAKPMTAVVALRLSELDKLNLDAPVQDYIAEFPAKRWPVTARHLLGHLGGVRHYRASGESAGKRHFRDIRSALSIFAADELLHQPGEEFLYTTYGYNLLGAVVESAAESSFEDLLSEHVYKPAGMQRTQLDNHFAVIENRARGYTQLSKAMAKRIQDGDRFQVGDVIRAEMHDTSMKVPGGGLLSTAPDLVRFAVSVNRRKLLKDETVKAMWTRQKMLSGGRTTYGLGWSLGDLRGVRRISHGGAQAGTATYLCLLPEQGVVVGLMSNLQGVSLSQLGQDLAAIVGDVPAPVSLAGPVVGPADDYADIVKQMRPLIEQQIREKRIPAFSIALVDGDRIVWAEGFGEADPERKRQANAHTIYRVGSVSKLLTDVAVMQQVELGKLDLDSPIQKHLPEFQPKNPHNKAITLRQLMSHRSGLVREPPVGHYFDPDEPTLRATVESLNSTVLTYPPEMRTKYSNAAVAVAGYAVEKTAGEGFEKYVRERVLQPLGMTSSDFGRTDEVDERLAEALMWSYDGQRFAAPKFALGTSPAGNLYSSVVDLGKFLQFVFRDGRGERSRVLKSATLRSMLAAPDDQNYGIGFRLSKFSGEQAFGHGGAVYGFSTQFKGLPDSQLGVVAVASLDGANGIVGRIADHALGLALAQKKGAEAPEFKTSTAAPLELTRRSVGAYQAEDNARVAIYEGSDQTLLRIGVLQRELRIRGDAFVVDDAFGFGPAVTAVSADALKLNDKTWRRLPFAKPAVAPGRWRGLIGEYGWDHNVLYILEHRGQLYALIEWFFFYPLKETGENEFAFPNYGLYHGEKLYFHRGDDGVATRVVAAEVKFDRRPSTADGETFKIKPLKPIEELRKVALAASPPAQNANREPDLVDVTTIDKSIRLDIRYATENNFMGSVFYKQPRAFLQRPAAEALGRVQKSLAEHGYGLLIHDAYRPWFVTKMFWDATPAEMKDFVANPASGSRHNRGCAVDLTLYDLKTGKPVQMVAGYDEFSSRAFPLYPGGTSRQRWLRDLLRLHMQAEGFSVYQYEWWHFDYRDWREYPLLNKRFEQLKSR